MTDTLNEDQYIFMVLSRSVLLRMRNVSDKRCTENQNTRFVFSKSSPPSPNRAILELVCKNIVEPDRPQMTIWRMRIACCIPNTTNTHSDYVMLIAFPLQQRLHERASMLRCTVRTFSVFL